MTELSRPTMDLLEHAKRLDCFTPTGLDLPRYLSNPEIEAIALQIKMMADATGWARADLALYLKQHNPKDYETRWASLAGFLGKVPATIANDALVAAKYAKEERERWLEAGLSYSHCRIAASVEPPERREDALLKCVEGDKIWSVHQLSRFLFGDTRLLPPPSRDAPPLRERVGGWLDTLNESDRGYAEYYVNLFVSYLES